MNGTKGTVLVVDDEAIVLDMEATMLQRIGFSTLKASNSEEACQVFNEEKEHIDLVVLDIIMPDENGTITYKRLKRMNPDIRVLISTGYGTDKEVEEIVRESQNGLIQKPFKFAEFSSKIEAILSMN